MPFITVEGLDGSGKTTLCSKIAAWLQFHSIPVVSTREPDGAIRDLIKSRSWDPMTTLLLFEADRSYHVKTVVRPALDTRKTVLCDRYCHSTLAYNTGSSHYSDSLVHLLNEETTDNLCPHLVIWVKVRPETALTRCQTRDSGDAKDTADLDFLQKVHDKYEKMIDNTWAVLDGEQTPEQVFAELLASDKWRELFPVRRVPIDCFHGQ